MVLNPRREPAFYPGGNAGRLRVRERMTSFLGWAGVAGEAVETGAQGDGGHEGSWGLGALCRGEGCGGWGRSPGSLPPHAGGTPPTPTEVQPFGFQDIVQA